MAVIEYMHHVYKGDHRKHIPGFVDNPGHWQNPSNSTWIGWLRSKRDFYVPDTLNVLTKEDFVQRTLQIHAIDPISIRYTSTQEEVDAGAERITNKQLQNETEVREYAEKWYDEFVAFNEAWEKEQES